MMVKATMPPILNTNKNIFMRLYSSVEKVVTMCLVFKILRLLYSFSSLHPPPPPEKKKKKKKKKEIHDLDSSSKFTYQRAQN